MNDDIGVWLARTGEALASASRWIMLAPVAALGLQWTIQTHAPVSYLATAGLIILVTSLLLQLALMVRIEFDARILKCAASSSGSPNEALATFDEALLKIGLRSSLPGARPMADRVMGVTRLVRYLAAVSVAQLLLLLVLGIAS